MAKKTYIVEVDSADKRKAFEALLVVLGFDQTAEGEFVEKLKSKASTSKSSSTKSTSRTSSKVASKKKPVKKANSPVKKK